ncbi:uncharacterized protein RCC_00370 [Ramularia collo-cygni]|uniref:Glycosyltransferase family 31 protein n=1 Tax=Ramularia collo-cygni TaxID=112498 RepID=A0A2D3V2A6_9PEZI|nr:uncharacterized protein RCC_00370 [Ramularia collo-cygni]CZT14393.1 uncharacterized protein RCC_00370 [Ramularia collo-cygni]
MDTFTHRGVNFFRLFLIFALLVSLFCFRDLWLPTGNDEYLSSSPIPRPTQQHLADQLIFDTTTPPPSPSTEALPAPTILHPALIAQPHEHEEIKDFYPPPPPPPSQDDCRNLPGADKIMVMLKTGATEIYSKLPTHLLTTFTCIPNYKIYSDLEQTFGNTPITDVIHPVSQHLRETHEDFNLYRDLQKWQREGQDLSKLKGDHGWNLDKWKFLPMIHDAFESAGPEIEWFVMIEADTALSWLNLLPWLQTMNPKEQHYLGSQNVIGDTRFAHGGSGIIISRAALETLEEARSSIGKAYYDERWEEATSHSCCGDAILAEALKAVNVSLTGAWPVIQGETISSIDFSERNWCHVPTTWHHVSPIQVDAHWQFQAKWAKDRGWQTPFLYRDIFEKFVADHVSVNRTKWNNLSKDVKLTAPELVSDDQKENDGKAFAELEEYEQRAVQSQEDCAEACHIKGREQCVQWMWTEGRCHLGKDVRLGSSDEKNQIEVKIGERMERGYWNCGWVQPAVKRLLSGRCEGRAF